jgi:hypothetical protein
MREHAKHKGLTVFFHFSIESPALRDTSILGFAQGLPKADLARKFAAIAEIAEIAAIANIYVDLYT